MTEPKNTFETKVRAHIDKYLHHANQDQTGNLCFYPSDVVDIIAAWEAEKLKVQPLTIHEALDKNTPIIFAGERRQWALKAMQEFAEQAVAAALKEKEGAK
jgi:hypothetical protein